MEGLEESTLSYYGWLVVGMAILANLTAFGLVFSFSVFLKPLAAEFGWTRAATAGAFSVYAISHNLFAPFAGGLCDRFGPKITAALAGLCLGGSMILMSHMTSILMLYCYFALLFGFGIAATYTPMMAAVSGWFMSRRGLAVGLASTGAGLGFLIMSPFAAWLISCYGWRIAYAVAGIVTWAIFIPVTIFVRRPPRRRVTIDMERQSSQDYSFIEALRSRSLWVYIFSYFFITIALWPITVHIVPLLTDKGVSLTRAGFLAGLIGGSSVASRISGGFFSDRLGRIQILLAGFILQVLALIWLLFSRELWMFTIFVIFFGISYGLWGGVIAAFPADYFGLKATGSILGFVLIIAGIGIAIGPYVGGYIFDITDSYDYMIMMCILAAILAAISALFIKPPASMSISDRHPDPWISRKDSLADR